MKLEERTIIKLLQENNRKLIKQSNELVEENNISKISQFVNTIKSLRKRTKTTDNLSNEIISNIANRTKSTNFFNDDMLLKEEYLFLEGYEEILIKNMCSKKIEFTKKQLNKIEEKNLFYILNIYQKESISKDIIEEINNRIKNNTIIFNNNIDDIYLYLYISNKLDIYDGIEYLINDQKFIKVLDKSNIPGSMILNLTKEIKNRKYLLENSKIIKNSILGKDELLSSENIVEDLTDEEIKIIFKNIEIANYIITNGICLNKIPENSKKHIISNPNTLNFYSSKTIVDLTNSYKNIEQLSKNTNYIFDYLSSIDKNNYDHKLLKLLNYDTYLEIKEDERFEKISDIAFIKLIAFTNNKIKEDLLKQDKIKQIISNNLNEEIVKEIPSNFTYNIIINKKQIQDKDLILISKLSRKEIRNIFEQREETFDLLINNLKSNSTTDISKIIISIPEKQQKLIAFDKINELKIDGILKLLNANKSYYKNSILESKEILLKLINETTKNTINKLEELLKIIKIPSKNLMSFIEENAIKDTNTLLYLINTLDNQDKEIIMNNSNIKNKILQNPNLELNNDLITYLMKNKKEIKLLNSKLIYKLIKYNNTILNDIEIAKIIITNDYLIKTIKLDENNLEYFLKEELYSLYNKEIFSNLFEILSVNNKEKLCNNKLIKKVLDDQEYKVLINILSKNNNSIYTLDLNFINEETLKLKFNDILKITKYPKIQKLIIDINKKYKLTSGFLNNLIISINELDFEETMTNLLEVFNKSVQGIDRKSIGNLPVLIEKETPTCNEFNEIIEYMLYHTKRYGKKRPKVYKTPSNYEDIKKYTKNTEKYLEQEINNKTDILNNYLIKHFKLTKEEALIFNEKYNIDKINEKEYVEETKYIFAIKNTLKSSDEELINKDKNEYNYSMLESFILENKIKKMYEKTYNFELQKYNKLVKKTTTKLYGKEIEIYTTPQEFTYAIMEINPKNLEEDYKKSYIKYINKEDYISLKLIANDNLLNINKNNIIFGYNKISTLKNISSNTNIDYSKFTTPRELIDNTRDTSNNIIIDKYDENIIEPDYIITFQDKLYENDTINKEYLELIYRISTYFNYKKDKNIPIIVIDINKIVDSETSRLKENIERYDKNHDVALFTSVLTKLENNINGCKINYKKQVIKLNTVPIESILDKRINTSESISELEYLKNVLENEENKYKITNKYTKNNQIYSFNIKNFINSINIKIKKYK